METKLLPTIAKLASKHGISPLKKYGQNFIFDETLCDKIVRLSAISSNDSVIEIGPGPGGLTRSILKISPVSLKVVEMDPRVLPILHEIQSVFPNLDIILGDALKWSLKDLGAHPENKISIVSNLPYNIGTQLLINWIKQRDLVKSITIMLQKEVVERITAKVSTKQYGRLSVICQMLCDVSKMFDVSPKAFYPQPKIWSSILHVVPKRQILDDALLNNVEMITHLAFSNRRKMIKKALAKLDIDFKSINIDETARAENLIIDDYINIAKLLNNNSI